MIKVKLNNEILKYITEIERTEDVPYILVEDSFVAIKRLAKFYKSNCNVKTVGIIGSVGKTSTKEMVAAVLGSKYNVVKTEGNLNNEVGVPITVFSIRDCHEVAVIEMGISDFGEMDRLGEIVRPDICVMTNIGPCHLEFLHDLDGVLKAKTEVFSHMCNGSVAVLNGDDVKLRTVNEVAGRKPVFYGRNTENEVYATNIESMGFDGTNAMIHTKLGSFEAKIVIPGEHMVDNALAATAVGIECGLSLKEIARGLKAARTISGRNNVIETKKFKIVDDCYNANPKSMKAGIELLGKVRGRKVAILGDMFELGKDENVLHKEIGEYLLKEHIDSVILAGKLSKNIYDVIKVSSSDIELYYKDSTDELIELLKNSNILKEKDTILVKASHGMNYAKIISFLQEMGE